MTMMKVCGEPPWLLALFQSNWKYPFLIRVVGQWIWMEIACWKTKRSAIKGWLLERRKATSFRIVTPFMSMAVNFSIGEPSEQLAK